MCCADAALGGEPARFLAVVPDRAEPFPARATGRGGPRGRHGPSPGRCARRWPADHGMAHAARSSPIVDCQQSGVRTAGGTARHSSRLRRGGGCLCDRLVCAGHPVIALLVGKAMSGAFLAHGYQANRILALDSPEVLVHAMGKHAAARVTRRIVEELERLGQRIAPMAYDVRSFATLGLLSTS